MKNTIKNKDLLTEIKPVPSRRCFYLGMSAVLLLGGCDPSYTYHSLTGTREKQETPGMRRTPVLNKRPHSSPSAASPAEASTQPSAEVTPYDQYDANGNEVSTAGAQESGNFFTHLFGLDDKPAAKDPAQYARKPLPGNPYSPLTSVAAPVVDAQVKDIATPEPLAAPDAQAANEPASEPVSEPAADSNTSASAAADEAAPSEKQEGFFERIASFFDSGSKQGEQQQGDTSQPSGEVAKETVEVPEASTVPDVKVVKEVPGYAGEADSGSDKESLLGSISSHFVSDSKENQSKATYPQLSSIPATPTEFDSVKQEQQQNLNELKSEHGAALQDKEALDREVSGLPPEEAGLAPQPSPRPDLAQPDLAMPVAPSAPASGENLPASDSLAKAPEEKSIFSHFTFSDHVEPSVPAAPAKEAAVEEHPAAAQPQEEAKQPQPSFEPASKLFEANTSSKGDSVEEPPAAKQEEEAINPAPVFTTKEANIEEQPSAAQPQEEAGQSQPVFEPAEKLLEDTASLPSPEIIKSMRPSRYEVRRKQAQNSDY